MSIGGGDDAEETGRGGRGPTAAGQEPGSLSDKDRYAALARLLRERRRETGMSRRELTEATGLSYPYVAQLEGGYRAPSLTTARRLAEALGLAVDLIVEATGAADDGEGPASSRSPARSSTSAATWRAPAAGRASAPAPEGSEPAAAGSGVSEPAPRPRFAAAASPRYVRNPTYAMRIDAPAHERAASSLERAEPGRDTEAGGDTEAGRDRDPRHDPDADAQQVQRLVDRIVGSLESLPPQRRLDAIGLVQSRIMAALVEEQVRKASGG